MVKTDKKKSLLVFKKVTGYKGDHYYCIFHRIKEQERYLNHDRVGDLYKEKEEVVYVFNQYWTTTQEELEEILIKIRSLNRKVQGKKQ